MKRQATTFCVPSAGRGLACAGRSYYVIMSFLVKMASEDVTDV